jgi:hypothetical protein
MAELTAVANDPAATMEQLRDAFRMLRAANFDYLRAAVKEMRSVVQGIDPPPGADPDAKSGSPTPPDRSPDAPAAQSAPHPGQTAATASASPPARPPERSTWRRMLGL